jgi:phosphoribosylglycinamide formyltransferase-1
VAVISNQADAAGLAWAQAQGLNTACVPHKNFATRAEFDAALQTEIERYAPDCVALAGFMRILSAEFVQHFAGRLMNIHPSLLPAFKGLHTHEQALQAGVKVHGASVHFVTPALDDGAIIAQAAVPVLLGDTPESLAARVIAQEHIIYPQALLWFLQDKLKFLPNGVVCVREHAAPKIECV